MATWKEKNIKEKFKFLIDNLTVEPILTCYILPNVIANLATQNLNLEKACRVNLAYPQEICDAISSRTTGNLTGEEEEVQKLVVGMTYWQSVLKSALPAVLIVFLGSFSDRSARRKPFMLIPMCGEMFTSVGLILCTYFYLEWPMEAAGVVEAVFPAVTGGWTTMFMAVFSYMGDITSVASRTVRLGIVNVFVSVAVPIGTMGSGFLYQAIGFYGVFITVAIMYFLGILYGAFFIREAHPPNKLTSGFLKEFLDPKHVVETFRVAFKSRTGNLRVRVILVMILSLVIFGPIHGEIAVGYLFARYRFNWDEVDFSIYSTYGIILNLIGTSLAIGLFSHTMKMEDSMLGALACLSKIIAGFFYAFAKTPLTFYLASLIDMIGGTNILAMRSIASKLVPSEELGSGDANKMASKVALRVTIIPAGTRNLLLYFLIFGKINSLFGVCEAIVPIIYQPLYSYVYHSTIKNLPGAFFIVGSSLLVPAVLIFGYLYYLEKHFPLEKTHEVEGKTNESFERTDELTDPGFDTKL